MVPKGLIIAIIVGVTAGAILGAFLVISNDNQVKFVDGLSLTIITAKTDYTKGESVEFTIINSGTIPIEFADSSLGVKITALDGTVIYHPASTDSKLILNPGEQKNLVWDQIKNDGKQALQGTYKISSETVFDGKKIKKSTTINILK